MHHYVLMPLALFGILGLAAVVNVCTVHQNIDVVIAACGPDASSNHLPGHQDT